MLKQLSIPKSFFVVFRFGLLPVGWAIIGCVWLIFFAKGGEIYSLSKGIQRYGSPSLIIFIWLMFWFYLVRHEKITVVILWMMGSMFIAAFLAISALAWLYTLAAIAVFGSF